jgi:hypothetical protein
MLKLLSIAGIWLATLPAFCQSAPKYQVGTITEVKLHEPAQDRSSEPATYDVSIKVANTIYVVLYTPLQGVETVKYAAGRDGLVLVGERTIRYNDLLGEPHDLPIESQRPATSGAEASPAKAASK